MGTFQKLLSKRSELYDRNISAIEFVGNLNTSSSDLLDKIELQVGSKLDYEVLNEDIKALYKTGIFYYIETKGEADGNKVRLIFEVKERPRAKDLQFIGADEVFPSDLREKIPIKDNEIVTPQKLAKSREIILKKYRDEGYFMAYVKVEMGEINPKTNTVVVKFIIDEGDEIPVSKINIFGNSELESTEIRSVMDGKESGIIESGNFKEGVFESDKNKIIGLLKSKGYIDAEIVNDGTYWEIKWENPKNKDKRVVVINYKISEGDQYFFNGYKTVHDMTAAPDGTPIFLNKENNPPGTPISELKPVYEPRFFENFYEFTDDSIGEVFDETKFFRDRNIINESYSEKGYLFTQVIPRRRYVELSKSTLDSYSCEKKTANEKEDCLKEYTELNIEKLKKIYAKNPLVRGKKFVHIDFTIRENNLAYIENIIIKGNKKTVDRVIRREFLFKPGDLFNSALVNRSRERIFNLGYFKEVNFNMRPGSDETKMNLIVEIVEQPTGTVSMGGGYGTISGFSIFTELGENNLNGTGQRISSRLEFGPIRRFVQLNWTEPWLNDKPWSLTLSMFYTSRTINVGAAQITENNNQAIKERATYDRNGVGVSAGIGHRFLINWSHFHRYSPSFFSSTNPSSLVSDQILAEVNLGWQFRSQMTNGISYDNRDNVFNPTTGLNMVISYDYVGRYLGGQSHFDQYRPLIEYYHTWFDYTFFGLIRNNMLRRWRVVQEFRTSSAFTFEGTPKFSQQDPERVPFIQVQDRLFLGGFESLRGWFFDDRHYPDEWKDGSAHRILWGTELRFPIEPSLLWFVIFLDAGAMYEQISKVRGERREFFNNYANIVAQQRLNNPVQTFFSERFDAFGNPIPVSPLVLNDPARLDLNQRNLAMDNFRYSWGFGLRIQIPVLPLRLFFAQKLRYVGGEEIFTTYADSRNFQFVFGIGDIRF